MSTATPRLTRATLSKTLEARVEPLVALPNEPLISVLLINYNYAQYLSEALDSLLVQDYQNWEAILVDDGSQDNSREIMSSYAKRDNRFRCIFKENKGVPSALNDAYAQAQGDIIALLDSDDAFLPGKLNWCVDIFRQNPEYGFAGHVLRMVDKRGAIIRTSPDRLNSGWLVPEALSDGGRAPVPAASGLVFRREVARVLFPIPISFRRGADSYLACVALLFSRFAGSNRELALYRQHGANITSINSRRWPDRVLMTRMIEDLKRTEQAQLQYIQGNFNLDASETLSIEDCWSYKVGIVSIRVLCGAYPDGIKVDIQRVLSNTPSPGLYWTLFLLLKLPRILTVPFVYAWLGEYPGKRLLYPLVRLFRLRRELARSDAAHLQNA